MQGSSSASHPSREGLVESLVVAQSGRLQFEMAARLRTSMAKMDTGHVEDWRLYSVAWMETPSSIIRCCVQTVSAIAFVLRL
jgi:hypothetical protein